MKAWEYLSCGIPVVYADLPIIEEVLAGKGVAYKPGDARDFARAVEEAAKRPIEPNAAHAYSWDAKAESILAALSKQS